MLVVGCTCCFVYVYFVFVLIGVCVFYLCLLDVVSCYLDWFVSCASIVVVVADCVFCLLITVVLLVVVVFVVYGFVISSVACLRCVGCWFVLDVYFACFVVRFLLLITLWMFGYCWFDFVIVLIDLALFNLYVCLEVVVVGYWLIVLLFNCLGCFGFIILLLFG